jgi:quercetin dioxygenase-like cupin family protein
MSLVKIELGGAPARSEGVGATVLFEHDRMKVRRIELAAGARIPPCQMHEDVVFVVVAGWVVFRAAGEEMVVASPGAVFIPGGAVTRSMEAREASLVLAVLCHPGQVSETDGGSARP